MTGQGSASLAFPPEPVFSVRMGLAPALCSDAGPASAAVVRAKPGAWHPSPWLLIPFCEWPAPLRSAPARPRPNESSVFILFCLVFNPLENSLKATQ